MDRGYDFYLDENEHERMAVRTRYANTQATPNMGTKCTLVHTFGIAGDNRRDGRCGFWLASVDFTETAKCIALIAAIVFLGAVQAFCQTTINLQTQSRNPDFSTFPFTRPTTVGALLPSTCQVGQLFFNTAAAPGANLYACTTNNTWTLESSTGSNNSAWSGITAPAGNLSVSMGSYTSLFTFGSSSGSNDLFKWTDSASNSGTGALGHFTTAAGSSAIPWQADANGVGWMVNSIGQLQGTASSSAGMIALPQGNAPVSFPSNSFAFYAPPSIGTSYQWMLPASDAAGAVVSDGNGIPGHLSLVGFSGTGNIAKVSSPTITTPIISGAEEWLFTVGTSGVMANTLCKTDSSFNIIAVTTSDIDAYGVCQTTASPGTMNYAVARYGQQAILVDGAATIGNVAIVSTTNAGYVHDSGQTSSANIPIATRIIGPFKTAASASGQTATVDLTPAYFGTQLPNSSVTIQQAGTAQGNVATLNCSTNVTCSVSGGVATIAATSTASSSFAALTSATNTQAAMVVGTGGSLAPSGSGSVEATSLVDSNQNAVIKAAATPSATNQITVTNAANGGTPVIAASGGSDPNIPLTIQGKGTGRLNLNSNSAQVDNAGNLTVASCNGCGGSATAPAILGWNPWGYGYGNGTTGGALVASMANAGMTQSFVAWGPVNFTEVDVSVAVASGTSCSGGTCGLIAGVFSPGSTLTPLCLATAAYSGNPTGTLDTNTTGLKALPIASGTNVSGGVCSLPAGTQYILMLATDSTVLKLVNYQNGGTSAAGVINRLHPYLNGTSTASISTGNGPSLAFSGTIASSTFTGSQGSTVFEAGFNQ